MRAEGKAIRVLFFTATYPTPEAPVAGVFVREHARAAARHCEVAVVHLDRGGSRSPRPKVEHIEGEALPTWRVRYGRSYAAHGWAAAAGLRAVRRSGFEPDVLHAHVFFTALPPLLLRWRLPVVVTEQWSVFLPEDPATLPRPTLRLARLALPRARAVLPASEALRRGMEAAGIRARYRVVPNVVDTELFHPDGGDRAKGPLRLLSVGLLYPAKGIDLLLEAVSLLARRRRDFALEVVGDGPNRAEYEALAGSLGLDSLVTFRGILPKPEIAGLMREADLFVLPSRYDNNPCALLEAQASGLPAVAANVGGVPEIVEPGLGLLAAPEPGALAEALEQALDSLATFDPDVIARRAGERYGMEAVANVLADVYVWSATPAPRPPS